MLERPISRAGWTRARFDQIATQINDRVDNPAEAGVERYVGLEHLDPDSLRIRRWGEPTDVESTKLRFQPDDIIFGKRRVYQRKVAVADFEGICSAHAMVLRAKPDAVLPEFLPFFMQSDLFMERALSISVGSLSPTINWKALAAEEFLLPPIQEQARLVEALGATDTLIESYRAVEKNAHDLTDSLVHNLITRPDAEITSIFLEDLVEPDRPICYGILMPGLGHPGGVPVIKVKDYPDGFIIEGDLLLTTPELDEEYRRSRLRSGDLLISIRGTIGRLAFVPPSLDGANITQDTARLSIRADMNANYVRLMLESADVQQQIARFTTGLAVKGINIGELRKLQIPMLPEAEQALLVDRVRQLRSSVGDVNSRLSELRAMRSSMMLVAEG
ncbi:restriction endonuclease subunit S [Sinorhizobium meliloti]|uniref:restriction endonuclease subunit S n=1 Tax=Rhizobium meliloti TaxID=382 RepID=UPI0030D18C23